MRRCADNGRGGGSAVQRSRLSKMRREKWENWNREVRCDGSWAKDGSHVIDLLPLWLSSLTLDLPVLRIPLALDQRATSVVSL